ncbi:MAG: DUF4976 domain-containing protein, partial [Armatimonadetes bacterium]|nr:DUF4976 domain-containing protein [Armatimonadota bacterium]
IPAAEGADGESLAPLLANPQREWPHAAYTQVTRGQANLPRAFQGRSVRNERYRYTEWDYGRRGAQLYDYETDPEERSNLAGTPAHAAVEREMKALLERRFPRPEGLGG